MRSDYKGASSRRGLAISARFFLVLAVFVPALGAVALVGWLGLQSGQHTANELYRRHLVVAQSTSNLSAHLDHVHETALEALIAGPQDRRVIMTELLTRTMPAVDVELATIRNAHLESRTVNAIVTDWQRFHASSRTERWTPRRPPTSTQLRKR